MEGNKDSLLEELFQINDKGRDSATRCEVNLFKSFTCNSTCDMYMNYNVCWRGLATSKTL